MLPGRVLEESVAERPIVLLGIGAETAALVEVYGLSPASNVTVADTDKSIAGVQFGPFNVKWIEDIDLFPAGAVINCVPEYSLDLLSPGKLNSSVASVEQFCFKRGLERHRLVGLSQPGSVHRILLSRSEVAKVHPQFVGHQAIFRNVFARNNYGYGMALAAELAIRAGRRRVCVAEAGVWFGDGLKNLCEFADFLGQTRSVEFQITGFDTGAGLPPVVDYRDHPELWTSGSMAMPNFKELSAQLPEFCELLIGDVKETMPGYADDVLTAETPLAFLALDVDLYTSATEALRIFSTQDPTKLMPVIPIWADDTYVGITLSDFAGEALAISEFNAANELRKIDRKLVRPDHQPTAWHHSYYFAHVFDHPARTVGQSAAFDQFFINRF